MADLDQVARALSDPVRLQILDLMVHGRTGDCCSPRNPDTPAAICGCDIRASLAPITPSLLSYHMRELRTAGLIDEQKRGKWVYYSIRPAGLTEFVSALSVRFAAPAPGSTGAASGSACCPVPLPFVTDLDPAP